MYSVLQVKAQHMRASRPIYTKGSAYKINDTGSNIGNNLKKLALSFYVINK